MWDLLNPIILKPALGVDTKGLSLLKDLNYLLAAIRESVDRESYVLILPVSFA